MVFPRAKFNPLYELETGIFLLLMPLLRHVRLLRTGDEGFQRHLGILGRGRCGTMGTKRLLPIAYIMILESVSSESLGAFTIEMADWCLHI